MAVTSAPEPNLPDQKGMISNGDKEVEQLPKTCENGKSCHQCRQKTMYFAASCKNQKKDKQCTIKFCQKCLLNRYGEKADEMAVLEDWKCPKCRGICNCSFCMKRRGFRPTGVLVHKAKATGFSSVSELLHVKGPENFGIGKIVKSEGVSPSNPATSHDEPAVKKSKKQRDNGSQKSTEVLDDQKLQKDGADLYNYIHADMPLLQGTELTDIDGIELPPSDVGLALQFLEFCATFGEIIDLKEGEPEYMLEELMRGGRGCRGKYSPVVQFHIQLLSLIQKHLGEDSPVITSRTGKNSWLHALKNCASKSQCVFEKLKLDGFSWEADDYESLDSSNKLRLLTFLCDEALSTVKMRSWMDDQNSRFVEKVKEARKRVLSAKHKEKRIKQKIQDKLVKAINAKNGNSLSLSECEAAVSQFKADEAQAHAELLECVGMVPDDKQRSDAVRTEPLLWDIKGRKYWRLKTYDDCDILLQDVGTRYATESGDKWFTFDAEQVKEIEKYIYSLRERRLQSHKVIDGL